MVPSTKTKVMGVIGNPIDHSLSPLIHNNILERHAIDGIYLPFCVTSQELGAFSEASKVLNFAGFNVTMPHKQAVFAHVDEVDSEARSYNSINTVKNRQGSLVGYNTDVRGLFLAFEGRGIQLRGKTILVIGAGGVAGSLVKGSKFADIEKIIVLNRTVEKAEKLCKDVEDAVAGPLTDDELRKYSKYADIIVNCTSLGMDGVDEDFKDLSFLDKTKALLCDLIYNPWETKFLEYGRNRGLETMNGIDMLIYQGILALEIFADIKLDPHKERKILFPLCKEKLTGKRD